MITDLKVNAKYVGVFLMGKTFETSVQFATTYKPNWFHRLMYKWLLGQTWMSIADVKKKQGR